MSRVHYATGALLAVLGMAPLAAQQPTGTIRGRVTDATTRQPLAGATVTFGGRGALTQADGHYLITGVAAASDTVRARMLGYAPRVQAVTLRGRDRLNFLTSIDIEPITVLRDASAAAIYGANASSGVVLITTRAGRRGGPQFEYSTSVSASSVTRLPTMLNADQFRAAVTQYAPQYVGQLGTANTNWFDLVDRTAYGQDHNLSVSGAGDLSTWRLSFGYLNQDGVIQGSTAQRLSLGLNYSQ